MFQNIKVDMIYFQNSTDFELEFNLCGCCRMRLLTAKASDKTNLLNHLVRAVARSRVILITGDLFGSDGIINIVSKAIDKNLTEINNSLYGISGDDSISIIEGSTPLVTPEGYFGGCIIESGPQSMVLLTQNKTIRKSLMQTLIHPYIAELDATDFEKTETAVPNVEHDINNISEVDIVASGLSTTAPQECENASQITTDLENNNNTEAVENEDICSTPTVDIFEAESPKNKVFETNNINANAENVTLNTGDNATADTKLAQEISHINSIPNYAPEFDFSVNQKQSSRHSVYTMNIPILVISIILLILLAVLTYCIIYVPTKQGISVSEYLKEIYSTIIP